MGKTDGASVRSSWIHASRRHAIGPASAATDIAMGCHGCRAGSSLHPASSRAWVRSILFDSPHLCGPLLDRAVCLVTQVVHLRCGSGARNNAQSASMVSEARHGLQGGAPHPKRRTAAPVVTIHAVLGTLAESKRAQHMRSANLHNQHNNKHASAASRQRRAPACVQMGMPA